MRIAFVRTYPDITREFLQGTDIVVHEAAFPLGSPWCHVHTLSAEIAEKIEKELGWEKLPQKTEQITFYVVYSGTGVLRKITRLFPKIEIEEPPCT